MEGGTTVAASPRTQEFPRLKNFQDCMEPLMGTSWEEKQSFLQLPQALAELRSRLVGMGLGFVNQLLLQGQCPRPGPQTRSCVLGQGQPCRAAAGVVSGRRRGPCRPVCSFPPPPPRDAASGEPTPLCRRMLGWGCP